MAWVAGGCWQISLQRAMTACGLVGARAIGTCVLSFPSSCLLGADDNSSWHYTGKKWLAASLCIKRRKLTSFRRTGHGNKRTSAALYILNIISQRK